MLSAKAQTASLSSVRSAFRGSVPAVRRTSAGLARPTKLRKATQIQAFKITFKTPDGDQSFECDEDTYLLDAADEAELDMPYSCRAGSCATCLGKIESGELDQSEGTFLDEDQQGQGWVLTCISYPKSDLTIASHQEGNM